MNKKQKIAASLVIISFLMWGAILVVPFIDILGTAEKAALMGFLAVAGEVLLWVGALMVGREVMVKYRHKMSPKNWFKKSESS